MKMMFVGMILAVLLFSVTETGRAQGTFRNLDFESPILPLNYDPHPPLVSLAKALPGWRGYIGDEEVDWVAYNTISLGAAAISFHNTESLTPAISGTYSVMLQASVDFPNTAGIGQVGQIPPDANTLVFYGVAEQLRVSFAGQPLALVKIGNGIRYDVVGADVSAFAGQTGDLKFVLSDFGFAGAMTFLDNIHFSPEVIPEPGALALTVLGALLLVWRMRKGRS